MNYPTDIVTLEGWRRIWRGHGLDRDMLIKDYELAHGTRADIEIDEVHLHYQPRVMWCSNHGDGCDSEGEWHHHWHGLSAGPDDTKYTLVGGAA